MRVHRASDRLDDVNVEEIDARRRSVN